MHCTLRFLPPSSPGTLVCEADWRKQHVWAGRGNVLSLLASEGVFLPNDHKTAPRAQPVPGLSTDTAGTWAGRGAAAREAGGQVARTGCGGEEGCCPRKLPAPRRAHRPTASKTNHGGGRQTARVLLLPTREWDGKVCTADTSRCGTKTQAAPDSLPAWAKLQ